MPIGYKWASGEMVIY